MAFRMSIICGNLSGFVMCQLRSCVWSQNSSRINHGPQRPSSFTQCSPQRGRKAPGRMCPSPPSPHSLLFLPSPSLCSSQTVLLAVPLACQANMDLRIFALIAPDLWKSLPSFASFRSPPKCHVLGEILPITLSKGPHGPSHGSTFP